MQYVGIEFGKILTVNISEMIFLIITSYSWTVEQYVTATLALLNPTQLKADISCAIAW